MPAPRSEGVSAARQSVPAPTHTLLGARARHVILPVYITVNTRAHCTRVPYSGAHWFDLYPVPAEGRELRLSQEATEIDPADIWVRIRSPPAGAGSDCLPGTRGRRRSPCGVAIDNQALFG
jgi:hypothetical protein